MLWYVSQNGKASGPFDEQRLAMLVHWGKISRDAFICDQQCSVWISIRRSAFAPLLQGESDARAADVAHVGPAQARPPARNTSQLGVDLDNKLAFGLCAFCFLLAGVLMVTVN